MPATTMSSVTHQHEEALPQGELDNAMDHCGCCDLSDALVLQRILELQEQAAVAGDALAFFQAVLN